MKPLPTPPKNNQQAKKKKIKTKQIKNQNKTVNGFLLSGQRPVMGQETPAPWKGFWELGKQSSSLEVPLIQPDCRSGQPIRVNPSRPWPSREPKKQTPHPSRNCSYRKTVLHRGLAGQNPIPAPGYQQALPNSSQFRYYIFPCGRETSDLLLKVKGREGRNLCRC